MHAIVRRSRRSALVAVLAAGTLGLAGCGDDEAATAPVLEEDVADVRGSEDLADPYTGDYDERFAEDVESYHGLEVTLRADVGEVLSPSAFTITAPEGGEVEPLLVLAEEPVEGLTEGSPVTVAATPRDDFDAAEVAEEFGLELDESSYEEWAGDTYLTAAVVEPA